MDALPNTMDAVNAADWAAAAMALPPGQRLTIGVIARNGLPFLHDCLSSLPPEAAFGAALDVILVDSASDDGTTQAMLAFAAGRRDAGVFRIEGTVNAAAARNVILDHARPGCLMLLDGDMVLDPGFIAAGLARIAAGQAAAVVGALREQRFDAANRPDGDEVWRHPPAGPKRVRTTGGAILLGPAALAAGLRYDERQRICEDWDFALRLTRRHTILRIPERMALHLTHYYFSPHRAWSFYRDLRPRLLGRLLRKHAADPSGIAAVFERERGVVLGGALQGAALAGAALALPWLAGGALLLLAADAVRIVRKGKGAEWFGTRIAAPWMVAYGLVRPGVPDLSYAVRALAGTAR